MKGVLLLGHGSNRAEANQMVESMASKLRADLGTELIEPAFLQLAGPDIGTGLARLMERGCREIFVLCLFLVSGNHHSRDAGVELRRSLEAYPGVKFTLSEPLLVYPGFYDLIASRVGGELHNGRHFRDSGLEIERESFEIVDRHLAGLAPDPGRGLALADGEKQVVRRVVHATADPELGRTMVFHPQAVTAALSALRQGRDILTDVNMVAAGIDGRRAQQMGARVVCALVRTRTAGTPQEPGLTRTQAAMREMLQSSPGAVVVVGNAPTALLEVVEAIAAGRAAPPVVVGVPVGFVGAAEAKERLENSGVPFITNRGPRGGSPVAVAIVNALLRLAEAEGSPKGTLGLESNSLGGV